MKKTIKIIKIIKVVLGVVFFSIVAFFSICLFSCNSSNHDSNTTNNNSGHSVVQDSEAHYLIFMVDTVEIEKMLVVPSDTFENIQDYFPTIPEREGYNSYWEEIEVYSDTQKEIYINAYYTKK